MILFDNWKCTVGSLDDNWMWKNWNNETFLLMLIEPINVDRFDKPYIQALFLKIAKISDLPFVSDVSLYQPDPLGSES